MAHDFAHEPTGGELDYSPTPKQGPALSTIAPSPDFRLAAHPARWEPNLQLGILVPRLTTIPAVPGTAGVGRPGEVAALQHTYEPQGWTILDPAEMGKVSERPFYVRKIRVTKGIAHLPAWQAPIPGTDRTRVDRDLYHAFLKHVVTIVPKPDVHHLRAGLRQAEEVQARFAQKVDNNPQAARIAKEWAQRVAIWQAALDEAEGRSSAPAVADASVADEPATDSKPSRKGKHDKAGE